MVIKSRSELKKIFKDYAVPTPADFDNLLDSALLKVDDQIFGKWRAGFAYKPGDVVLYDNKLYSFTGKSASNPDEDCNCGGGNKPPGEKGCWAELRIDVNDHDWEFSEDKSYMYVPIYGKIGMGTKKEDVPQAFLHLNDDKTGGGSQFLFNPSDKKELGPMFKMTGSALKQESENTDFVAQYLNDSKVQNETNTLGFLFKKLNNSVQSSESQSRVLGTEGVLLFITANENEANLGIGTKSPNGMVDIVNEEKRQILLNPSIRPDPEITLINLDATNSINYLSQSLNDRFALLTTNAERGFMFRKGIDYEDFIGTSGIEETGSSVMVVNTQTGNVGIGTDAPNMRLQVEGKAGKVQANLDGLNPSINIIDPRPRKKLEESPTYLAVGAADDVSVLSTNAKKGFVFKRGTDMNDVNDKIQLGDSNGILKLYPQDFANSQYNALFDGYAIAKGFYMRPAPFKVNKKWKPLTKNLERLVELSPVVFQYDDRLDEKHFGFEIEDMVNNVVEATLQLPDDSKVIAYQNLVTMLVGAVKELNTNVENLTRRVNELEKKGKK